MKKAGWMATVAAGVVLVGGGAWGATMLAVSDEAEVAAAPISPTPEVSATPTAEATPAPTATPTVEPTSEVTETPEVEHSELEQLFIDWARPLANDYIANIPGLDEMSDEELLAAIDLACETQGSEETDIVVEMPATDEYGNLENPSPEAYASKDLNLLFIQAARLGPDGATGPQSYCADM